MYNMFETMTIRRDLLALPLTSNKKNGPKCLISGAVARIFSPKWRDSTVPIKGGYCGRVSKAFHIDEYNLI